MDPAVLNYLQSQQQPNQNIEQAPQQRAPYNPFDAGISKAISSARESLGMTAKQQNNAFNNSLLTFGDNIAQQPKQKGFWNNFGSVGRALSPAIRSYNNEEEAAITQNNALANQMLAYQAAEEKKRADAEQQAWERQHKEAILGETRRAHDMLNSSRMQKSSPMGSVGPLPIGEESYIPIQSKSERLIYSKDKKASGEILHELSSIKGDYDKFKDLAKNDLIHPMTPYGVGTTANAAKDFFGYFSGKKELREETTKRKALEAKLGKFAVELERKIKGGVLSEGMVKRFENKGLLPALTDTPDVFEEKLNNLTQEMSDRYKASDASLRHGVHLSPYDLEQLEKGATQEDQLSQENISEEPILMQDGNGNQYMIPANEIKDALNDGLIPIE
jgi:hypothetical protein